MSSWSARRAAVAAEAAAEEQATEDAAIAQQHAALAEKSDEAILEELGLPDPDSLAKGDDFKAFMSKSVPAHLRKRALRTLWNSNPVLACVDGLNDYDDDYLAGSFGQEPIKTAYQVGKGMLAHLRAVEEQKNAKAIDDDVEPDEDEEDTIAAPQDVAQIHEAPTEPDPEEGATPAPRRMQFIFEDETA